MVKFNPNLPPLKKNYKITVDICTKNRYDILSHAMLSIALQTKLPQEIIITDDSDNPVNLTTIELYRYIFQLFDEKKIEWKVLFGKKMGQHHSHQTVQEIAKGDLIFRMDDDCVAEPDVLEKLLELMEDKVGAIAPAVLSPDATRLPTDLDNKITNLNLPNIQWFKWEGIRKAEHLYSCFLYRKGIAKYELSLSNKAHREETLFSHSIYRSGYQLLVRGDAKVWHFRSMHGGIRTNNVESDYHHDEGIFRSQLELWEVNGTDNKMIVLDCGIGDHWAFKNLLPVLKEKHRNITIAACFPDVFFDEPDLKLISIADAKNIYGDINKFNVYKLLWEENDKGNKIHLIEGFKKLYL